MSSAERRRNPRLGMTIAVMVQGFLPGGATWNEMTETDDVSAGGASINLKHDVQLGQALFLTLAMPKRLRQYDLADATYRVYSLVRGISRRAEDNRVGIMFFGKFPPRGFQERPWARFLLPSDSAAMAVAKAGAEAGSPAPAAADPAPSAAPTPTAQTPSDPSERRTHPRVQIFLNFTIQQVDEWGAVLQEELVLADNVSKGGAHVVTSLDFEVGDVVLLQEAGGGFATRAAVRSIDEATKRVRRLHLKFVDRQAPDRLLKA